LHSPAQPKLVADAIMFLKNAGQFLQLFLLTQKELGFGSLAIQRT